MRAHQRSWEAGTLAILRYVQESPAWQYPQEWDGEPLELIDEENPHDRGYVSPPSRHLRT